MNPQPTRSTQPPSRAGRSLLLLLGSLCLSLPGARLAGQTYTVDPNLQHVFSHSVAGGSDFVQDLAVGPNGSLYVVGQFDTVDGVKRGNVVRFLPDGTVDPSYPNGGIYQGGVTACALQDDGKLIVGLGVTFNDVDVPFLSRLTAEGALDPTFDPGEGPINVDFATKIDKILIAGPDEIYVGGWFNLWNLEDEVSGLIRIRGDGSRDATFNPEFFRDSTQYPGLNSAEIDTIRRYPDGRVLVCGYFDQVNGEAWNDIVRLNPDGSIDESFQIGTGPEQPIDPNANILDAVIQPGGKVVITGTFATFNGTPVSGIVRLNEDGSIDPSFTASFSGAFFAAPSKMQVDSAGRLVINGIFDTVNGEPRPNTARLLPDGELDPSFVFDLDLGFNVALNMVLNANDEPVFGGGFQVPGFPGNNLLRLAAEVPGQPSIADFSYSPQEGALVTVDNPTGDILILLASTDLANWTPVATNDTRLAEVEFAESAADPDPTAAMRFYQVQTAAAARFDLDNFDRATPGTTPDAGSPVGEWGFPAYYVAQGAAEANPSLFTVVATSGFDPSGTGNSLKIAGSPTSGSNLPALLPEVIEETNTERVVVRFDIFVPSGPGGGCFVYVGGDHGVGGYDSRTARGPQLAFRANGQVMTYDGSPAQSQGTYPRDAWLTVELDINLRTDRYALSMGPRGGTLTQLAADVGFRSGAIDHIDRFSVAMFADDPSWLAYLDNVSLTAMP
ncbi:MAG: delta-60 repeat domain-containing protein [Verrucomicrobiales bacterium]|nr:delta-60 repeat domain-containing protein [Verrucomicrobiales bacterium]